MHAYLLSCILFRNSLNDNKLHFVKLCSEKCQNSIKLKNLPNAIFEFQTNLKNAKIVTFGIENANLATMVLGSKANHD